MSALAFKLQRYLDKELFGGSIDPHYDLVCICTEDGYIMRLDIYVIHKESQGIKHIRSNIHLRSLETAKFDILTYTCDAAVRMGWSTTARGRANLR